MIKLTPPNRPVENGLELVVPGIVIILLAVPSIVAAAALMRCGVRAAKFTRTVDVLTFVVLACGAWLAESLWGFLVAAAFAADAVLMAAVSSKAE